MLGTAPLKAQRECNRVKHIIIIIVLKGPRESILSPSNLLSSSPGHMGRVRPARHQARPPFTGFKGCENMMVCDLAVSLFALSLSLACLLACLPGVWGSRVKPYDPCALALRLCPCLV